MGCSSNETSGNNTHFYTRKLEICDIEYGWLTNNTEAFTDSNLIHVFTSSLFLSSWLVKSITDACFLIKYCRPKGKTYKEKKQKNKTATWIYPIFNDGVIHCWASSYVVLLYQNKQDWKWKRFLFSCTRYSCITTLTMAAMFLLVHVRMRTSDKLMKKQKTSVL